MASNNENRQTKRARASVQKPGAKGKGKGKLRGNTGKLAGLIEMPLDIFIEVSTHLLPLDLLHLARTSRNIRKLLMSRLSTFAWRRARENVPHLPECPEDLSEPEYASLLYERNCHVCGTPRIQRVIFAFRARLCESCYEENVSMGYALERHFDEYNPFVLELIPRAYPYDFVREMMEDPEMAGFYADSALRCNYYVPDVEWWGNRYHEVQQKQRGERDADTKKRVEAWVEERKAHKASVMAHADALENWKKLTQKDKETADKNTASARVKAIMEKLYAEGWTDADVPECCETWHKLVYQSKPLTPRIWKTLYPKLVPWLEETKHDRLYQLRKTRVRNRKYEIQHYFKKSFGADAELKPAPSLTDIVAFPSVVPFIRRRKIPVTKAMWAAVQAEVRRDTVAHVRGVRKDLVEMMEEAGIFPDEVSEEDSKGEESSPETGEDGPKPPADPLTSSSPSKCSPFIQASLPDDSSGSEDIPPVYDGPAYEDWDYHWKVTDEDDEEYYDSDHSYHATDADDEDEDEDEIDDAHDRVNTELLSRATSVYVCGRCSGRIVWYTMLGEHIDKDSNHYGRSTYWGDEPNKWSVEAQRFSFSKDVHAIARALLQSLEIDERITHDAIAGKKFKCLRCESGEQKSLTWAQLIAHFCKLNAKAKKKSGQETSEPCTHGVDVLGSKLASVEAC
ncbi:hypothetical protein BOTBODRAFT_149356 [Botryobasidium botryosum FD-172 SS1]|uniref:F-box domain-containing protein n=1 Tax=Botryobasidium botryosum (strain FD-172 SS1) TaxID=930990 RepID=A0A067M681_BOTB1|nr:hypothetical protein BOTBODRAFT_149356 [Botryobasidium botryosum FD-172 SS1]